MRKIKLNIKNILHKCKDNTLRITCCCLLRTSVFLGRLNNRNIRIIIHKDSKGFTIIWRTKSLLDKIKDKFK